MSEGLSPEENQKAKEFTADHHAYGWRAETPEKAVKPAQLMQYKANLWESQKHVNEHLPEYKVTAAEEMKAETGMDFNPAANDAMPPVVEAPKEPLNQ